MPPILAPQPNPNPELSLHIEAEEDMQMTRAQFKALGLANKQQERDDGQLSDSSEEF